MGILAFTCYCVWSLDHPGAVNPYAVHDMNHLADLLYDSEYWYGCVCTREWAAALYA